MRSARELNWGSCTSAMAEGGREKASECGQLAVVGCGGLGSYTECYTGSDQGVVRNRE